MARKRLTTFSKLLLTIVIVGAIVGAVYSLLTFTPLGNTLKIKSEEIQKQEAAKDSLREIQRAAEAVLRAEKKAKKEAQEEIERLEKEKKRAAAEALKNKKILRVQVGNSAHSFPGLYSNKGWKHNPDSQFFEDTMYRVEFIHIPSKEDAVAALKNNRVDVITQSIDELPTLQKELDRETTTAFMQIDWSRGDLVLFVKNNINSINELKSRDISFVRGSSAETFFRKSLEAAGMSVRDIDVEGVYYEKDAINAFNRSDAEAIVITANQTESILSNLKLGKVLLSTKQASHTVARTFVSKTSFINDNPDLINQFYESWMNASNEIKTNSNAAETAAFYYANELPFSLEEAKENLELIYLADHTDNVNFFKLNSRFDGITGEDIYKEMGKQYSRSDLAPDTRKRWTKVITTKAIESANETLIGRKGTGEKGKQFIASDENEDPIAIKPLSINFPYGESTLTESSKSFIDVRISKLLQAFCNTRIRIEGNTAKLGDSSQEIDLSNRRARAVAAYLISEYNISPERFVVKGNGTTNPVRGCETFSSDACKAKNRRTEFHLLRN